MLVCMYDDFVLFVISCNLIENKPNPNGEQTKSKGGPSPSPSPSDFCKCLDVFVNTYVGPAPLSSCPVCWMFRYLFSCDRI